MWHDDHLGKYQFDGIINSIIILTISMNIIIITIIIIIQNNWKVFNLVEQIFYYN